MGGTLELHNMGTGLPVTKISLSALRRNWRFLTADAGSLPPLAVIKADAYGHGIIAVAKTLIAEGCALAAVGSAHEGAFLRAALGSAGQGLALIPLLGMASEKDAAMCVAHSLIPLVQTVQGAAWLRNVHTGNALLPVAVKVDTGMSRLGFRRDAIRGIIEMLQSSPNLAPTYLLSHFASADDPEQDASVLDQAARFMEIFAAFRDVWPGIVPSLANSAAHLARRELLKNVPPQMSRPGYALYGGNPFAGTVREDLGAGLVPVMEVSAPVLGVHPLAKGAAVSYGGTFISPAPMTVAVIGAGYADGFSRGLSGKGRVSVNGVRCPILGRVCMQMHIADVSAVLDVAYGDTAHLLGGAVSMADIAADWGTSPYEVLCLLGRNTRNYV